MWKYWFGIHAALFFWEKKSSWEVWGTPETNQRFYHGYPDILTWPTSPWFGDSSFHLLVIHGYKNNHQRAQVWIQHQKCTNRAFYIKSLIKKKYHVKILIWDPCRFVLLGKEIFLGSMGNLRNKPKVLPWIAWYFNMAHRSMIWWFIFSPVGHPPVKKQPPKGPSLDSAPKVHKSSILYKEFNKEKISCENTDLGSMPLCSFGKRNLPGKYGEHQKQTKGFTMDSLIF